MSSVLVTETPRYGTLEVSYHEYVRLGCYKLAEVTSKLAVPVVTALSWYFLAYNCEDESPSDCVKNDLPTFFLATTSSICTGVQIFKAAVNCRRDQPYSEEVLLSP